MKKSKHEKLPEKKMAHQISQRHEAIEPASKPQPARKRMDFRNVYYLVYGLIPHRLGQKIEAEATYAGFEEPPRKWVAISLIASVLSAIAVMSTLGFFGYSLIFRAVISAMLILGGLFIPYVILSMMSESRRKDIEAVLPDVLLLASSNVRSGLTIDKALLFSARPEFGFLGQEIKLVALQIFGGTALPDAFESLTKKIKSQVLSRTVNLLLEGLKSGGAVAQLLEESATDIRNTEILQREIRSNVMTYMIFIFLAAVLGAPFLFGVSTFLVLTTVQLWSGNDFSTADQQMQGGGFISLSAPDVDMGAFNMFVISAILLTTFFASILISLIQTGKASQSFRYMPGFMALSLVIYFATKALLLASFGSFVGL